MATSLSSIDSGYVDSLAGTEPGWLAAMRKQAFSQYQLLPAEVSPLYSKYSDINKIKPQNVHFAATTQAALGKDLSDRLKELEGDTGVLQVGQEINKIFVRDSVAKQGVIVSGIQEAVSKHGDLIKSLMEANQLNYADDKFLALEAAAFQSGVFVYIPKNVALEDPIRLITSLAVDGTSLISRNIVVADTGSKATVVQELYASGSSGRQDTDLRGARGRIPDDPRALDATPALGACRDPDRAGGRVARRRRLGHPKFHFRRGQPIF